MRLASLAFAAMLGGSALAFAAPSFAAQNETAPLETGKPAPDFTATDSNGKTQKLSDYKGKIVVLEWMNPGCPFVKKHYSNVGDGGNMQNLQKELTAKGVIWLSVNSSAEGKQGHLEAATANTFIHDADAHPTALLIDGKDGALGHLYDAKTTPHMFVIDKTGTLAYQGAIDDKPTPDLSDVHNAKNYVREAVQALQAGKKVEVSSTQSYGCSVKY